MTKVEKLIIELKNSMEQRFDANDQKFVSIDNRFESIDKRFESIDQRFKEQDEKTDNILLAMQAGFEAVDKKFEDVEGRLSAKIAENGDAIAQISNKLDLETTAWQHATLRLDDRLCSIEAKLAT